MAWRQGRTGQGRRAPLLLLALLPAGCDLPKEIDPMQMYRVVTGAIDEGRQMPPGLDLPTPNLALVPPRPVRPEPRFREELTRQLAADRSQSREALPPRQAPAPPTAAAFPGQPPVPAAPPRPATLAAAPPVRLTPTPPPGAPPDPQPVPLPEPGLTPALPPPELLAPAPPRAL